MNGRHRRHRFLLVLLISSWAISWPLVKVGFAAVPPTWYACFRYTIAATCLFAFVAARHEVALPPHNPWELPGPVFGPRRTPKLKLAHVLLAEG
jgi:drug/metabolite transporter (DMT)-like permease